jgi:hypothetical protein
MGIGIPLAESSAPPALNPSVLILTLPAGRNPMRGAPAWLYADISDRAKADMTVSGDSRPISYHLQKGTNDVSICELQLQR